MSGRMTVTAVKVRMYKRLLGDCFLIRVEGHPEGAEDETAASHILIDCGVLQGTPNAGVMMDGVVDSIYATTGDKPLDLVVVTHEHHDHISGFGLARDRFETRKLKPGEEGAKAEKKTAKPAVRVKRDKAIDQLWFAWTEDPADEDARKYQAQYGHAFATLTKLAKHLGVANAADGKGTEKLGLAGFSGPLAAAGTDPQGKPLRGSRAIYKQLREWAGGEGGTRYLSPGQVLATPGALGLKAYVLGPPRDPAMLTKALPSAGAKAETYLALAGGGDPAAAQGQSPFSPIYRWRSDREIRAAAERAATPPGVDDPEHWLGSLYYEKHSPCSASAHRPKEGPACRGSFVKHEPQKHRMLDDVARSVFSNLSLRMDSNTNNTSLVLAFELPDDAGVMLFAADAQVGNWLSWETVKFRENPKADPLSVTAAELLARTRLYKVGHHGSHNATLAAKGLDLMSDDLVALIPTDAKFALEQSSGWLMPNPRVEAALMAKTRRRVLRGDRPAKEAADAYRKLAGEAAGADFAGRIAEVKEPDGTEYVEYTVYKRGSPS